jgi:3-oxoacyl-[acyl-carrier-protein] synthase II
MSPLWLLKYLPNMPASHLAIYSDLRGPNNSLTLREASAGAVLGEAFQVIAGGRADAMLVGSTGTRLHLLKMVHAALQEELATETDDPARACRPFERDRTGMVLGEGAGAVVLETQCLAEARGARIWAEVLGGVAVAAVGPKMEARREAALANAMRSVLRISGLSPDEIGHVQAHGLSTRSCDIAEAQAIHRVFGDRGRPVPVTAAKSYFGNLGAGSGMVELVAGVLALAHDRLFPVMNYGVPDPACPIAVVGEYGREPGDCFIQLSVTPQGQASAVVVGRY